MNTTYLWAVSVVLVLAVAGWLALRRRARPPQRPPVQAGLAGRPVADAAASAALRASIQAAIQVSGNEPGRAPAVASAKPNPANAATGSAASVLAQRQAATEALRQARRRMADEAVRLEADRVARQAALSPAAPKRMPRPPEPAGPAAPLLGPQSIQLTGSRAPGQPLAPAGLAPLRPPGPPTVLVADDSKVVRVKTGRLLEKQGWRVLLAEDGQTALKLLQTESPDLLVTDVEMPGLDGFELTRRLRASARWARLPVIMVTSSDDKHRDEAFAVGINVLLGKPYADEALLAHVQQLRPSALRRAEAGAALH